MELLQKKIAGNKGFTLVEMLVAMAIFMMFIGVLIGSYSSIVKAQREANEYRIMYVEARAVFERLVDELREGMVDYGHYSQGRFEGEAGGFWLVSKDGMSRTQIYYDSGDGILRLEKLDSANADEELVSKSKIALNNPNEVKIKDFKLYVSPVIDPYNPKYVEKDSYQFQPKVTIYAVFEKELSGGSSYTMDLQTTVSSRIYNQVYEE